MTKALHFVRKTQLKKIKCFPDLFFEEIQKYLSAVKRCLNCHLFVQYSQSTYEKTELLFLKQFPILCYYLAKCYIKFIKMTHRNTSAFPCSKNSSKTQQ